MAAILERQIAKKKKKKKKLASCKDHCNTKLVRVHWDIAQIHVLLSLVEDTILTGLL